MGKGDDADWKRSGTLKMETGKPLTDQIKQIACQAADIIEPLASMPAAADTVSRKWVDDCRSIPLQLDAGILRIAVAGAIKSGKSTLINSLLGKDLVKRGAGVVTAVTTRIRKGKKNRAVIYFKSWDDINTGIQNALALFPDIESDSFEVNGLDIRRKKDRLFLEKMHQRMAASFRASGQGLRPEMLVLRHALDGFESVCDVVKADSCVLELTGQSFSDHKLYSADLARAFYVKDICLEIVNPDLNLNFEIADCQGSDSTDPGQMAHILNYLETANLIVYVISGRTGLRQADISFLSTMKQMGLSEHILFVNNTDLSEHKNLAEMEQVAQRILVELRYIFEHSGLFSFSCLYMLFDKIEKKLPARDKKRLMLWKEDRKTASYLQKEAGRFEAELSGRLENDRARLLVDNPLDRLRVILGAAKTRARLVSDMISREADRISAARERLTRQAETAKKIETIVDYSLKSALEQLAGDVQADLEAFLSWPGGPVARKIRSFVDSYTPDFQKYAGHGDLSMAQAVYLMFQDFRSAMADFMTQAVHPEIINFMKGVDDRLEAFFTSFFHACRIEQPDVFSHDPEDGPVEFPEAKEIEPVVDVMGLKRILGLKLPVMAVNLNYSASIKVTALTGSGLGSIRKLISRLLKKPGPAYPFQDLGAAARQIQSQCLKALPDQLLDYKRTMTNQYLTPLTDASARAFSDRIVREYSMQDTRRTMVVDRLETDDAKKEDRQKKLQAIVDDINALVLEIEKVRSGQENDV